MTDTLIERPASVQSPEGMGTGVDAEIVARATALIPLIREHAAQTSDERRVVPEVMKALEDAELFKLFVPKRFGGHGANMATAVETLAEISRGDGSTGWAASLLNVCTWFATTFSEQAQAEVFGANPDAKVCGIFTPGSKFERVEGGYLVSGRWPYSSGSFAADWAALGIGIDVPEGEDPRALALIPAEAWTIEPTWFVAGMRGSGSDTIVVEDHFVPDHRVQRFIDMREAHFLTPYKQDQNSHMAFIPVAALILVAPQLGLGRHALERTRNSLPGKAVAYTVYSEARKSPMHQLGVANAATKFHLAELLMRQACLDIDASAAEHHLPTMEVRARVRNDTGIVAELVKEGIDYLLTANGAGSFADVNVLNRIWRDAEIAGRHAYVSPEVGKEVYGKVLLGDDELTMDL
ncbi:acyl-CoA dehydrogenase family protein [uncultured Jatrophihabitans sp.]|uniref:acyl-CoA dehydrogenase family protein n=1 Tax=uncultured Jatrophihabitans sp. TaxID=1610747 RepID=UPI0035C99327